MLLIIQNLVIVHKIIVINIENFKIKQIKEEIWKEEAKNLNLTCMGIAFHRKCQMPESNL